MSKADQKQVKPNTTSCSANFVGPPKTTSHQRGSTVLRGTGSGYKGKKNFKTSAASALTQKPASSAKNSPASVKPPRWLKTVGMFHGDAGMEEVYEEGRRWREADCTDE